jgi:hypothetical protein
VLGVVLLLFPALSDSGFIVLLSEWLPPRADDDFELPPRADDGFKLPPSADDDFQLPPSADDDFELPPRADDDFELRPCDLPLFVVKVVASGPPGFPSAKLPTNRLLFFCRFWALMQLSAI